MLMLFGALFLLVRDRPSPLLQSLDHLILVILILFIHISLIQVRDGPFALLRLIISYNKKSFMLEEFLSNNFIKLTYLQNNDKIHRVLKI